MAKVIQAKRSSCAADPKAPEPKPDDRPETNGDLKAIQAAAILMDMSRSGSHQDKEWKKSEEMKKALG